MCHRKTCRDLSISPSTMQTTAASNLNQASLVVHLVLTGEGWITSTSIPWCRTSTARPAANADRNALVPEYSAVNGEQIAAAAEDVNTMPPRFFSSICRSSCSQSLPPLRLHAGRQRQRLYHSVQKVMRDCHSTAGIALQICLLLLQGPALIEESKTHSSIPIGLPQRMSADLDSKKPDNM